MKCEQCCHADATRAIPDILHPGLYIDLCLGCYIKWARTRFSIAKPEKAEQNQPQQLNLWR